MRLIRPAELGPEAQREWLVEPYVPRAEVTLLTGARRSGKGLFCALLAAMAARGERVSWDLGREEPLAPHSVFWVTSPASEDSGREIQDRFLAATGVPGRLLHVYLEDGDGVAGLRQAVRVHAGPKLVVLDPLQAVIGDLARHDVRSRMEELVLFARETGSTVIAIRHVDKAGRWGRGRGEIADVARSELVVGKHPDDDGMVVLAQAPSSYGEGEPIAFRLGHDGQTPFLAQVEGEWDDDITIVDLLPRPPRRRPTARRSKFDAASVFLLELLASGARARPEIVQLARRRRISERTLERAASELGIERRPQTGPQGTFGAALWSIPGQTDDPPEPETPQEVSRSSPSATPRRVQRRDGDGEWKPTPMPDDPGVERFRRLELD